MQLFEVFDVQMIDSEWCICASPPVKCVRVCVYVCVCVCEHVYVVYEDTNLYNDMGMT